MYTLKEAIPRIKCTKINLQYTFYITKKNISQFDPSSQSPVQDKVTWADSYVLIHGGFNFV